MKLRLAIGLIAVLLIGDSAWAAFVGNLANWQALGEQERASYVNGLFDRVLFDEFKDEASYLTARRRGLENCAASRKLTSIQLAVAVSEHYAAFPRDASVPPAIVFDYVVQNICIDPINAERAKLGLAAWPVQTDGVLGAP